MPRKKCKKVNKDNTLHMKTIKSRLIKISMKVENYIYKQKTISSVQAKDFLDEILSYETQCDGDSHCIQVIEKLRRHLNVVISNEDSNKSNLINNVDSLDLNEEEIANISSPTSEEVNQNVSGNEYLIHNNNQCNLPNLNKEYTENITRTNKNENKMQVEEIPTENTKIGIHKNSELNSTSVLEFNTDKMSEINNTPLDLTKPVKNSITNINLNQTRNTSKPKPVEKADKTISVITEVSQKFNLLELNEKINQDKPKKHKIYNKKNSILNSNVIIKHGQPLKAMQGCTNTPSSSNILNISKHKSVETNIVATTAEGKLKNKLHKNKMDFNDIYNQFCERNKITKEIVNEDNVKKIVTEKKKNKRKSKNDFDLEESVKIEDKKAKRTLDKNKSIETTNAKKTKSKQNFKKDVLKLDLSWFDTIKYIRQVDEREYFTIKDSNNCCQK